ncbi:hypothetical protein LguiB_021337 [Lonicera macranthoides]
MEENKIKHNDNNIIPIGGVEDREADDSVSTVVIVAESTVKERDQRDNNDTNDNGANAEESDAEEEEDDEDEDEGGTYKFRFEGDMNPLDFIEDDAFGVQPYQRFERLEHEYEALAAKKRKALADSTFASQMPVKKFRQDDVLEASFEEICESMYGRRRRRSRKTKKKGRQRGSKNKVSPEITRKLGDANLHYVHGRFEEAIRLSEEVILLSRNMPDPYHTLGLIYNAMGDKKKATNFYMIAARLTPKNASLWKLIIGLSKELGNSGQANFCLERAISAEPEDVSLRLEQAELYHEVGEHKKAAESYEQISRLCPENVGALLRATELYKQCGQHEHAASMLEDFLKNSPNIANLRVVYLLVVTLMEANSHMKALQRIELAQQVYCAGKELPLNLAVKAGICHLHLGHLEKAMAMFSVLHTEHTHDHPQLFIEVGDALMGFEHYDHALKYYMMLETHAGYNSGLLYSNIARCRLSLKERLRAIEYLYKALPKLKDSVDARLTLASLLLEEDKIDEAISVLSPANNLESMSDKNSDKASPPWWLNGKIKLMLSRIYKANGSLQAFVDAIYPSVRMSLFHETKVRVRRRLPKSVLIERAKVLDDSQTDSVFQGFRPLASTSDLLKAARAKKLLQKRETIKEQKRAAALAAGVDWKSDDSDDESPKEAPRESPLPNLLKDEEHHNLIIELCKALASLQKYWEALEIISLSLKFGVNTLSAEKKEELRFLGAQIAYNFADPTYGWECARDIVNQHPHNFAAWNCYYKVISKLEDRYTKHSKFLHGMRNKHKDCVPPTIIFGHQLTMISQHQAAAREYLEAYKLMPDSPLVNLCAGTALINLALGLRLQNKHQTLTQGLAFLYNNLQLCENSQESLYNIARAYHHVGLVSLAATYYEKVLAIRVSDYPIPKLPTENLDLVDSRKSGGYCDLRREAAYNLHLIYKNSGALDLARQVLKDHCSL